MEMKFLPPSPSAGNWNKQGPRGGYKMRLFLVTHCIIWWLLTFKKKRFSSFRNNTGPTFGGTEWLTDGRTDIPSYRDARTYLKRRNWIRTYRIKRRRRRKGSVGGASISGIVRAPKAHDHLKWRGKGLFQELTGYSKNSVTRTVLLFFVGLNYCFIQTRCINNDWKCDIWHLRCLFYQVEVILFYFQQLQKEFF